MVGRQAVSEDRHTSRGTPVRLTWCLAALLAGTGTQAAVLTLPAGTAHAALPVGLDFDGDRLPDLAMGARDAVVLQYGGPTEVEILRAPSPGSGFGTSLATGDFDADGFDDLAVGAPDEAGSDAGAAAAGAVWVHYGTADGLLAVNGTPHRRVRLQQGVAPVPGAAEKGDRSGAALAAGDLDGDGVDDLVVGAPGEALGEVGSAGSLTVFPGRRGTGLALERTRSLHQDSADVPDTVEKGDRFAAALAVGDVTNDARADLLVGVPGENGVGLVHLLPGGPQGLTPAAGGAVLGADVGVRASTWSQLDRPVPGATGTGTGASFGAALAVGDANRDGTGDVVVGVPDAYVNGVHFCGAVAVLFGASSGISATRAQYRSQDAAGYPEACEEGDRWGNAVAVGDLSGDGLSEVVVAAATENMANAPAAGAYTVIPTTDTGIVPDGAFVVSQNTTNVPDDAEGGDAFGWAIGLHDPNLDGRYDLVVSAPFESDDAGGEAPGAVFLILSTTLGRPFRDSGVQTGGDFSDGDGTLTRLGYSLSSGVRVAG